MQSPISVTNVHAITKRLVQLDFILWLEMGFVMMALTLLNVIMMVEIVVEILTRSVMASVTMKTTNLNVIMTMVTVVSMSTPIYVLIAIVLEVVSLHRLDFLKNMTTTLT
jgi:hypothetical protein